MSSTGAPPVESPEDFRALGEHYSSRALDTDDETWLEDAIEDYLGITVTEAQRRICRAITQHEKVLVQTANGIGKSFILAAVTNGWLTAYYPAAVLATSGTYPKLKRTFCKPVESLHDSALDGIGLPGEYKRSPPRIEIEGEPNQYFEASSPKDAGELEGVHGGHVLGIIEEADKDDVTEVTFESMESLVSDQRDRIVAIANPPRDETNSLQQLYDDPTWHVIRLSSFESHNVQVEIGDVDGSTIDGLATLWKIKQDWESYVGEPWPGVEQARTAHERRDDLDERWYRRRAGVTPPAAAAKNRPFDLDIVNAGFDPDAVADGRRRGTGIDVARSGDRTVQVDEREGVLDVAYSEPGTNHTTQFNEIWANLDGDPSGTISIDAIGEGSGKADDTAARFPDVDRFKNSADASQPTTYKDRWTEGLCELGNWLERGGTYADTRLRTELQAAARELTLEERFYQSRDDQVYLADPKSVIEDRLSHSPDHLDAAIMAICAAEGLIPEPETGPSGSGTW